MSMILNWERNVEIWYSIVIVRRSINMSHNANRKYGIIALYIMQHGPKFTCTFSHAAQYHPNIMLILAVVTNTAAPLVLTATTSKIKRTACLY